MSIKKRKGFNIGLMLAKLSTERTLNPDKSISMQNFDVVDKYVSFFTTSIVAEGKSDAFVRHVVKDAMNAEQDLTEGKFIKYCNCIANIKLRDALKLFKVVFPVWGGQGLFTGRRKWTDVHINLNVSPKSSFTKRAKLERAKQFTKLQNEPDEILDGLQELPLAVCSVRAVDVLDAFEQAEHAISKELGLYALMSGRGNFIFKTGPDRPINMTLLAPHMTVHEPDGSISVEMYWYNRWPRGMVEKRPTQNSIENINRNVAKVRDKIRKLPWRHTAEIALARRYSAFAQCDLEASFLDGWRLLEATAGHYREKSETLLRRAAWFFEERDEQFQIGLHLMHRRNLISHGRPVKGESYEGLAFQMKEFLTPFLHAFLTNPFNFRDIEEFWDFCDLPIDKPARMRQEYLLDCVAEFRRK